MITSQLNEEQKMLLCSIYEQAELLRSKKATTMDTTLISILSDGSLEIYVSPWKSSASRSVNIPDFINKPSEVTEAFVSLTDFISNPKDEQRNILKAKIAELQEELNALYA